MILYLYLNRNMSLLSLDRPAFAFPRWRDLLPYRAKNRRKMGRSAICPVCGMEPESTYHAMCRCPHARALWQAMREDWTLPSDEQLQCQGMEWLLLVLDNVPAEEHLLLLMLLWRIWTVQNNDITHDKPAAPIEASRRFLLSYVNSLQLIKQHPNANSEKGKELLWPPKESVNVMDAFLLEYGTYPQGPASSHRRTDTQTTAQDT